MDAAPFDRDYLIPALRPDFGAFRRRMASYSEISAMSAAVTRRLVTLEGSRLVPDELVELWSCWMALAWIRVTLTPWVVGGRRAVTLT